MHPFKTLLQGRGQKRVKKQGSWEGGFTGVTVLWNTMAHMVTGAWQLHCWCLVNIAMLSPLLSRIYRKAISNNAASGSFAL